MSRLYYEQPTTKTNMVGGGADVLKDRLEKVAKIIPGEIIAVYLFCIGLVPLIRAVFLQPWFYYGIFVVCLVLTPVYLNWQAEKGRPKMGHLIVSTLAFVLWAYAVSGAVMCPSIHDAAVASIFIGLFSLVSGLVPLS